MIVILALAGQPFKGAAWTAAGDRALTYSRRWLNLGIVVAKDGQICPRTPPTNVLG